jgi:hypothetical protein
VREYAVDEAAARRRGGVIDFRSLSRRAALYELIARRLDEAHGDEPTPEVLGEVRSFISEPPPHHDIGASASNRDARVAQILVHLDAPPRERESPPGSDPRSREGVPLPIPRSR